MTVIRAIKNLTVIMRFALIYIYVLRLRCIANKMIEQDIQSTQRKEGNRVRTSNLDKNTDDTC